MNTGIGAALNTMSILERPDHSWFSASPMNLHVLGLCQYLKILRAVIHLVAVTMMYTFMPMQWSAKHLSGDKTMLKHHATIRHSNPHVTIDRWIASAFPFGELASTRTRTKLAAARFYLIGSCHELLATSLANAGDRVLSIFERVHITPNRNAAYGQDEPCRGVAPVP
jgi:hypothetical protein